MRDACTAGPRVHLQETSEGLEVRSDSAKAAPDEVGRVGWQADLNGDGLVDVALSFPDSVGSSGETQWGVFVRCGGDEVVAVWGPEYVATVEVPVRAAATVGGWLELTAMVRVQRGDGPDTAAPRRLRFVDGRYQDVP